MQDVTQDAITSVLGDEFKSKLVKLDNVIRSLKQQEDNLTKNIEELTKQVTELTSKKSSLQEDISNSYSDKEKQFNKSKEDFDIHKNNIEDSFGRREHDINNLEAIHDLKVRNHQRESSKLLQDKSEFDNRKKSIVESLVQAEKLHSDLFRDAIDALNNSDYSLNDGTSLKGA